MTLKEVTVPIISWLCRHEICDSDDGMNQTKRTHRQNKKSGGNVSIDETVGGAVHPDRVSSPGQIRSGI